MLLKANQLIYINFSNLTATLIHSKKILHGTNAMTYAAQTRVAKLFSAVGEL